MAKLNQKSIRQQNLYCLYHIIYNNAGIQRQELAKQSGLSLMSVTNLTTILEQNNVLSFYRDERAKEAHTGAGRKADSIALNDAHHMWAIIDLTDIHFSCHALTLNMNPLPTAFSFAYDHAYSYEENLIIFLQEVRVNLYRLLAERMPIGIAVSVPGTYNESTDTVSSGRIPQINSLHLRQLLQEHLGDFCYHIDEDVKFAVRSFMSSVITDEEPLYYLYIGEGVGGAICLGKTVLRGLNGIAGDAGQIIVQHNDTDDTFENAVSLPAFANLLNIWKKHPVSDLSQDMLLKAIGRYAAEAPSHYRQALSQAAERIARILHNIVWLLDPYMIVIDCPYGSYAAEEFIGTIRSRLEALVSNMVPRLPKLAFASATMPATHVGAMQTVVMAWIDRLVKEV